MKTNRVIRREAAVGLDLASRVSLEAELTDAEEKLVRPRPIPTDWPFDDYRNRSPWRKYLFDFLGPLNGRTILDLGCGYNPTPVYFARAGAKMVYANEVSPRALVYVREMAERAGVADRVKVLECPAENLALDDASIDLVHGEAVLHHLALPLAGAEISRILKAGGRAGFKDPLGQNPVLEFARDYVPYKWKKPAKGTDRPLKFSDIGQFGEFFSRCSYQGFGFVSLIQTLIWGRDNSTARRIANAMDHHLLRILPFMQRYCRFVVTCVEK